MIAWPPIDEPSLLKALEDELLEETHHLELKREVKKGKGENKELGRDLASLAVDGGHLIVGIDEDDGTAHPVPLAGLPERIEQVGFSVVDEPLAVAARPVPCVDDPHVGYVVVEVPVSGLAPHMVDGKYFGRGEKTKRVLPEDEVYRLHRRRQLFESDASVVLEQYKKRDLAKANGLDRNPHLFVIADPVAPQDRGLVPFIEAGPGWQQRLIKLVTDSKTRHAFELPNNYSPTLESGLQQDHRGDGWALTSHYITRGRTLADGADEDALIELEVTEDGCVRLFSSRAGAIWRDNQPVLIEASILALTHRVLRLAVAIGDALTYRGPWNIGVAVTNLAGTISSESVSSHNPTPPFAAPNYDAVTRTSAVEMEAHPRAVAERAIGSLMRGIGTRHLPKVKTLLEEDTPQPGGDS